ncbi:MAG: AAA family ATPase, partial [Bacilli bacterium]|nr:AAA family ATPase [Bacilli bacterium]
MYLKQINAYGFKSFADKIDVKLDNKITCIVGPNGSGKSNVVDAVRWVLGEQSVKQLRGDGSMSDVIFSGSKSRKPLNVATVELVFDNSDHYLNVEYTDISIKRKAYRTGENEYFLNNEKCRLKDIINLLIDSGIGKESYNIISQGEVDKIISNSSMDRRTIIEDAAGVVKYKKRKEEALKKLDKTHDNLDRVNDIILELEQQVEPLREQSEKAKEYLENKNNLENLEIALLAYDIYNDSEEEKKLKQKLEVIEQKLVEENITSSNSDVKITEEQTRLTNKERELKEANQKLFTIVEEVEKLNAEKLLLQEKAKNKDISESEKKLRENLELEGNINSQIKILEDEIDKLNKNLNNKSGELISSEREIDDAKNRKKLSMLDYSNCDQQLITLTHKINGLKQEIENGTNMPHSIKKVLTNNNLTGIYNTIGNTLEIEDMYLKALETAIVSSRNFIITEDEESSKKAIRYLKEEHLGRATFFPLSVIKSRYVDANTLFILKQEDSFLGVLSDLVTYDKKYKNIIENQLGIVIVCKDINNAVILGKKINHRYKIVTLDGDVINVGGSMTGGSSNTNSRSVVTIKQELTTYENNKLSIEEEKERISNDIKSIDKEIESLESKYFEVKREEVNISEELKEKNKTLDGKKDLLSNVTRDISQLKN